MYHYVRPEPEDLPHFRYLHVEDFRRQLDEFQKNYGFVTHGEFKRTLDGAEPPQNKVLLTFDDALKDHHQFVFPELERRGLCGIFYVPTGMYESGGLLDVHRIHCLIGWYGGIEILKRLEQLVDDEMLSDMDVRAFRERTYTEQENDEATTLVKRILNYYISYEHRGTVLDALMEGAFDDEQSMAKAFYMGPEEIREMQSRGMIIGSHGITHRLMSKLDVAEQKREVEDSFAFINEVTGGLDLRTFCYPYGGFHSFSRDTEDILDAAGCRCSFNVEARDIEAEDLRNRPQALPRYDCNLFPFGKASYGMKRVEEAEVFPAAGPA